MDAIAHHTKCLAELQRAVSALGGDASSPRLPKISALIIQSMTGEWRSFHTPDHIFEVGFGGTPVEVIAALFHDVVYVQVDSGLNINLSRYLAVYLREDGTNLVIDAEPAQIDDEFQMCLDLFGFKNGQVMSPFAGQNEFLSAVIAVKVLKGILSFDHLVKIVACIEATIPFRGPGADGVSCSEQLAVRLQAVSSQYGLGFGAEDIDQIVKKAVRTANRDVDNFASENPADFLNNTWNLIPETNHELLQVNVFTVKGYRNSLQKMEGFLSFLQATNVFRQYKSEPGDERFLQMRQNCQRNLEVARVYLRAKLIAIAVLEAMSLRLGEGLSLSSVMGKLPWESDDMLKLETHLPKVSQPYQPKSPLETLVMDLLQNGRSAETVYDVKHSPVSNYMVRQMGFDRMLALLEPCRAFCKDSSQGEALLKACDANVVSGILSALHTLYTLRAEVFEA
jgi:hypothetical protein